MHEQCKPDVYKRQLQASPPDDGGPASPLVRRRTVDGCPEQEDVSKEISPGAEEGSAEASQMCIRDRNPRVLSSQSEHIACS